MRGIWLALVVVGCGEVKAQHDAAPNDSHNGDTTQSDAPIDAPKPPQHLYVPSDGTPGNVARYTLPLVAGAAPDFTISTDALFDVAFDPAGNLVADSNAGKLFVFVPPLSAGSAPVATFQNGSAGAGGQIVVTPAGILIASLQQRTLNTFAPPFTNTTIPSGSISSAALTNAPGVALDEQANLYVSNNVSGGGNIVMFPPPFQTSTVATPPVTGTSYRNVAISGTQLFVGSVGNAARVDVYNLPLTNTSAPAFSIVTGTNVPEAVDVDADGHLYVGNLGNMTVVRYSPPFSAGSGPDVTLTTGAAIFGLAVGP